jgi:signal peptidase II
MRFLWLTAVVVVLDQATKAAVLQFMASPTGISRSIPLVGDWLRLTFTENPGMAFGITIGPPGTVAVLSLIATCLVAAYIYRIRDGYAPYLWSLALILGGAVGNIIDRVFYGVLLDYGTWFTGHVVDFIHVSLWKGFIPQAVPLIGGSYMELFPIWNVADMSIVLGVVGVLFFHHTFHERRLAARRDETAEAPDGTAPDGPAADDGESTAEWPAASTRDGVSSDPVSAADGDDSSSSDSPEWAADDWPDENQ